MSNSVASITASDELEALSSALFSWCAERSIGLRTQEGVTAAGTLIDFFFAGYRTQEELLGILSHRHAGEMALPA